MDAFSRETTARLEEIMAQEITDIEKLSQGYDWITRRIIEIAEREIELARAMHDQDNVVKQQIKMSTVKMARGIFEGCYIQATGKHAKLWEAQS